MASAVRRAVLLVAAFVWALCLVLGASAATVDVPGGDTGGFCAGEGSPRMQERQCVDLVGKNKDTVGSVCMVSDDSNLYISIEVAQGLLLASAEIAFALTKSQFPLNFLGRPVVSKFPIIFTPDGGAPVDKADISVPLASVFAVECCYPSVLAAVHATLLRDNKELSAWAGELLFTRRKPAAFHRFSLTCSACNYGIQEVNANFDTLPVSHQGSGFTYRMFFNLPTANFPQEYRAPITVGQAAVNIGEQSAGVLYNYLGSPTQPFQASSGKRQYLLMNTPTSIALTNGQSFELASFAFVGNMEQDLMGEVHLQGTDAQGNTASAAFNVTVMQETIVRVQHLNELSGRSFVSYTVSCDPGVMYYIYNIRMCLV